uniref:H1.8 linker histone n=1 Tax=Papio anubis TaxID=9555 RepID=A0A8I5N787_PAPAN
MPGHSELRQVWDKIAPQHQDCHQPPGIPQGPDPGPDLSLLGPLHLAQLPARSSCHDSCHGTLGNILSLPQAGPCGYLVTDHRKSHSSRTPGRGSEPGLASQQDQLVPKHKRKIQPRKMAPPTAPRRVGEAKGKGPKKPSEAKEDPPNVDKVKKAAKRPAKVQKAPPKPGAATEKARKQGGTAKDTRAQLGEARKVPPKPDKAIREPSSASGLSRKAKAKGSRSSQGDAEACRKTTTGSKSSKPTASKVKNGAASPTKKKVVAKAKAKAPKAGQGPNTKAVAPAKGSGSKVVPAHLSRKTEAPKGPRKAGLPIKASSSKVSSQRAEA